MDQEESKEFEPDDYMEKLLALRESDPFRFSALPKDVQKVIEEYAQEKEAAQKKE